jgi:o-succinylbenzoate synthase
MELTNIHRIKSDIQSIEVANYTLKPVNSLNAKSKFLNLKEGFLLKINFKNFGIGYADCFSWEELGDTSITTEIKNLKDGSYNTHLDKSIYFASIDAQYRSKNQNIFKNLKLPKNHYTCVNYNELNSKFIEELSCKNFSIIKLKCGISINDELSLIKKITPTLKKLEMSLRLDFNSTLDSHKFHLFLSSIEGNLDVINFIEDPFAYQKSYWKEVKNSFPKVCLAVDRIHEKFFNNNEERSRTKSYDYLVLKPAVQNIYKIFKNNPYLKDYPFLFTSYMDHPLGQLTALYEASLFYSDTLQNTQDCGFLTHSLYEKNAYSETLTILDAKLIPSFEGGGFGLDALLEKERWRKLV